MTLWTDSGRQIVAPDGSLWTDTQVYFYVGDSSTRATVYKDEDATSPHTNPIRVDGLARVPKVYFDPTGDYIRAEYRYPNGKTWDAGKFYSGDPAATPGTFTAPKLLRLVKGSSSFSLLTSEVGSMIDVPASSGVVVVTLPDADAVTSGAIIAIRNTHGGGVVRIVTQATEAINAANSVVLANLYDTVVLSAITGGWIKIAETPAVPRVWTVLDRDLTTAPSDAAAGDTYLAATGAVSPWAADKIYVSDGAGNWTQFTPAVGWQVFVADETSTDGSLPQQLVYSSTGWQEVPTGYGEGEVWHSGSESAAVTGATPTIKWTESDASADEKTWRMQVASEVFALQVVSDDAATSANVFSVTRTGATVTAMTVAPPVTFSEEVTFSDLAKLPSYTVAALPTGSAGKLAYASNGRKAGEGGGSGTGVLVFHDGSNWIAVDTGATVAA